LGWLESRLREIAKKHSRESDKFFQVNLNQSQTGAVVLIEQSGYQPVRHFDLMVRPDLMDLPNYPLPEGLEVRPVEEQHYRAIWHVVDETSKEEWGYSEPTEEDYQAWLAHPHFQPHLWQVAWDTAANRVIGTVLTYINQAENEQFNQLRGYTEGLGILPEWRRQGVARALISLSLQAQKDAGMHESALVADGLSPFGLTGLYESCGFKIVNRDTVYQKKL